MGVKEETEVQSSGTMCETSDQNYITLWCELCVVELKKKIDAHGYCPDCNTLLCKTCIENHNKWPILKNHRIWMGSKMPRSQADKPQAYPYCRIHNEGFNNHYCLKHNKMVCKQCMEQDHKDCNALSILEVCKGQGGSEGIKQLRTAVVDIHHDVETTKTLMEKTSADLEKKEMELIHTAAEDRDQIIANAQEMFKEKVSNINEVYQSKIAQIAGKMSVLVDNISSLEKTIESIDTNSAADIDQFTFIKMQQIVENTQEHKTEIKDISRQLRIYTTELSFASCSPKIETRTLDYSGEQTPKWAGKVDSDIESPQFSILNRKPRALSQISAQKLSTFNVRAHGDIDICNLHYMDIDSKGTVFLIDLKNRALKLFSRDKIQSYFPFASRPWAVRVIDDNSAVVSTENKKLHTFDVTNQKSITLKRTVSLTYSIAGIAQSDSHLVVTCWGKQKCVKMIDMDGAELWSVSTNEKGQQLFDTPHSLVCNTVNSTTQVIVTDWKNDTITLLSASDGHCIKQLDVPGKEPIGVTVDLNENVYICFFKTQEICVFSPDFEERKIILTSEDLHSNPQEIVYNGCNDELYIIYQNTDIIERFQLN